MTSPFKAYDIRGRVGDTLTEDIAYALGRAVAQDLSPRLVATGRDVRESSAALQDALARGLMEGGVDVVDIGLCGTEEVYFATDHLGAEAGIMVTASHNPIDYNGMKLVGPGARPLSDAQFRRLEETTLSGGFEPKSVVGTRRHEDSRAAYVTRVVSFVDPTALPAVKLLANAGNGCAGPAFDAVLEALNAKGAQITADRLHHDPDGTFPNGIPNPLLPENQPVTADAVRRSGAALGVAWDGDFDRCFFFDETGAFIPGEYMVGLIAQAALVPNPGAKIVHDPRVIWNTQDVVATAGGQAVAARTGHALIKAAMRESQAVYGGEMSAHHYFRDFMFCDSGMIPWLMVLAAMGQSGQSLGDLVAGMRAGFPSSGEINFRVADAGALMAAIEAEYGPRAQSRDHLDGLSLDMGAWRFNLRKSNTEPLLRLNVETRGNAALLAEKTGELQARIKAGHV